MIHHKKTTVSLTLDQIMAFDLNPRLRRNRHYEEIKASIRERGLVHPLLVTRRPGDDFYIIASGGNTRLEILNDLWSETKDNRFRELECLYQDWQTEKSVDEGNLDCLLDHLIENDRRGALTFIERALGVQKAISISRQIHGECTQQEQVRRLVLSGYKVSQSQLSLMLSAVNLLLPYLSEPLFGGLSVHNIERLLLLRRCAEKFWDTHCAALPQDAEQQLPLFDDIFGVALGEFNHTDAAFSLMHIRDDLNMQISQALNIDYALVAVATDVSAWKSPALLAREPEPVLPEFSQQRQVDPRYQVKGSAGTGSEQEKTKARASSSVGQVASDSAAPARGTEPPPLRETGASYQEATRFARDPADGTGNIASSDSTDSLASFIDQTAWELAEHAGLEFLLLQTDSGAFDISPPDEELSNERQVYWQMLAFLAGRLPGVAVIWRQMLLGSHDSAPGFHDDALEQIFLLIRTLRRLYAQPNGGVVS